MLPANDINAKPVEAILKTDYEARLKADLEAILVDLQMEIQEFSGCSCTCSDGIVNDIDDLIQQKINKLKGEQEA